ncbi:hypothetical protein L6452_28019 [Arctium lappa]|uniref:Uncharacterized protein n=1 Tax=Arctium lappa TaxID=4217 RepID=A0ACB8ZXS8_ARCLA|nr:hypothetical protein L6452_28019 [Arctium lappa]
MVSLITSISGNNMVSRNADEPHLRPNNGFPHHLLLRRQQGYVETPMSSSPPAPAKQWSPSSPPSPAKQWSSLSPPSPATTRLRRNGDELLTSILGQITVFLITSIFDDNRVP